MLKIEVELRSSNPTSAGQQCRQIAANHGIIANANKSNTESSLSVPLKRKLGKFPSGLFAAVPDILTDWVTIPTVQSVRAHFQGRGVSRAEVPQQFAEYIIPDGVAHVELHSYVNGCGSFSNWEVSIPEPYVDMEAIVSGEAALTHDAIDYYQEIHLSARKAAGVSSIADVIPGLGVGVCNVTIGDLRLAQELGWTVEVCNKFGSFYLNERDGQLHVKRGL